jgi:hypothetical protein
MDESSLRSILGRLGIRAERRNRRGWIEFKCPLAPWTHQRGFDTRPSAAAKVNEQGPSSYVCKACHSHGRISKLVNQLAGFRQDNSIRSLMLEADQADTQAQRNMSFPDFDHPLVDVDPLPEPLVKEAYEGLYPTVEEAGATHAYLESRGIGLDTADKLGLVFDGQRIMFPVYDRHGRLYGFTGRAIDPELKPKVKDYYGLPKRHLILGEDRWRPNLPLIIVEGLFGFAHLVEIGVEEFANVGAILGSALTREKAERIIHADLPTYLLFDNDAGGDIGLFGTPAPGGGREDNGAVTQLEGQVPLYVPDWPGDKNDPDQLTLSEIRTIISDTPLFVSGGKNPFDKKWEAWV